ncbi:pyridoxal-phosphate dependent enzyme [Seonamhaeicola algicola]|uniref:Pyridoxal-phosphate dependent enzyme n=1 Tax=Seonamhaeicola algicola TaxID=1719036 RepID=A0A5C7AJZ1_9FLAO|nr:pyridoxal-phosphate dependent enzyme [Seonamhaeicola algicola]TXE06072.1 pyridoxal-phosphate dependent enzyme [Seonamhaeicola algicola]
MNKASLQTIHNNIKPYIHKTPVFTSQLLNDICEAEVFFKCENFQKMGAFKMRGATHAILNLTQDQKRKGVVTHSSGNFAQALALAAKSIGVKAYIVMPKNAPQVKKEAVLGYGGIISFCEPTNQAREAMAKKIQQETGATFLHPSNNIDVINGQATAAIELLEEYPNLKYIYVPVGGGGLLAGTILAANAYSKNCKVIAGEPENVNDAYRSLLSGKIESNTANNTIADGLKTQLGDKNFPIIKKYVESIQLVTEIEIVKAMTLIWQRLKLVVEPSSAVALAAVLKQKNKIKGKKIGVILSGGNVDITNLPF